MSEEKHLSESDLWIVLLTGVLLGVLLGLSLTLTTMKTTEVIQDNADESVNESELMCTVRTAGEMCVDPNSVWHGCNMTAKTCGEDYVGS